MKYTVYSTSLGTGIVAPYAGAWIEISGDYRQHFRQSVAPYAGAWIEMITNFINFNNRFVAPYAGAWIEIITVADQKYFSIVAPYAGAWIEISDHFLCKSQHSRRSLRGSVD